MKSTFCVVFVTAPTGAATKKLVGVLLRKRLVACVNVIPAIQSSYWWNGKIENGKESLLIMKTRRALFTKLKLEVVRHHPYTVPEILALPVTDGHLPYLKWIEGETR